MSNVDLNAIHADLIARLRQIEPLLVHNLSRAQDEYHLEYLALPRVNAIYERLASVQQIIQFPEKLQNYRLNRVIATLAATCIDLDDIAYEYEEYRPIRDAWVNYLKALGLTDTCPYLGYPVFARKGPYQVTHEGFGGPTFDKSFDSVYDAIYALMPYYNYSPGAFVMDDNVYLTDPSGITYEGPSLHLYLKRYTYGFGRNKQLREEPTLDPALTSKFDAELQE